ncbi:transmembrane protein, partial [Thraustotheca clavata]
MRLQAYAAVEPIENEEIGDTRSSRVAHRLITLSRTRSMEYGATGENPYTPMIAFAFTVNYILGVGALAVPYAIYHAGVFFGVLMLFGISLLSYITVMWLCETCQRTRDIDLHENEATRLLKDPSDFPEVAMLCSLYLGVYGARLYRFSLINLAYAGLIGYTQVFVNSLVSQTPIFLGITVTNWSSSGNVNSSLCSTLDGATYADNPPYMSTLELINIDGFGLLFSTVIYAQLFHHSVPAILAPLSRHNHSKGKQIFGAALLTTTLFYVALGISASLYFGPKLLSSVNLNWASFTWGYAPDDIPQIATFFSVLIVLFPALDTLSVFPLVAITLGGTLSGMFPHDFNQSKSSKRKLTGRLIAAIPPCIIALLVRDLSVTLQFSGIFGVYVAFIAPALLQYFSKQANERPNVYTSVFNKKNWVHTCTCDCFRLGMDWGSLFHDTGETPVLSSPKVKQLPIARLDRTSWMKEEHAMEVAETRSSRAAHQLISFSLSRSMSFNVMEYDDVEMAYTPVVAYSFTVNYILGVGSLGVPYALYHAGLGFGSLLLVFVSWLSYITVMWVSETMLRARELDAHNPHTKLLQDPMHFPEVTTLCERFLGHFGARIYQLSLLGLMYGGLIGYSQVFVNSIASQLVNWDISNTVVAVLFGLIVVPLSCVDLNEQIHVQVTMAILRFVALLTMIISAAVAVWTDSNDSGSNDTSSAPYISEVPLFNFHGFGLLFSTTVFSQLFQHSVPGLLAPLSKANQPKAAAIFGSALLTTTLFYL